MHHQQTSFHDYIFGKRIAVIGAGISNTPLVQLFVSHGCKSVSVRDRKAISEEIATSFQKAGAEVVCGDGYLDNIQADLVIRTPGLRPDAPQLERLRQDGARVVGETQLFLQFAPCKVFGVTGSDGKTTTTTLISKLLETTGKKVYLGGNIGTPLLPLIDRINKEDYACLELSSFQLMDGEFSPDVSVITNISENHLDWHKDMDEYILAKTNIFSHQGKDSVVILNADDKRTDSLRKNVPANLRFFSLTQAQNEGTYLNNGVLTLHTKEKTIPYIRQKDIRIPGLYNVANYLAALCAVGDLVSPENAQAVARSFNGVEHRVEWIRTIEGVDYYNSSIDSSPSRTIATLGAFSKKLSVICGGYDKNLDYSVLREHFYRHVKAVYVTGQTADKILAAVDCADAPYTVSRHPSLRDALNQAHAEAEAGDVVILSPASASFDTFKNFEERGRYFKELVYLL